MTARKTILQTLAGAALVVLLAVPSLGQMSGPDQRFLEGLEKRGLLTLLDQFLNDQGKSGADPATILEQQARLFEMQGSRAAAEKDRDDLFGKAKAKYRQLIDTLDKQMGTATETRQKDEMRLRILTLKVRLGEMIWQRESYNQRINLELTDRQAGDREKVERLLREATKLFQEINKEASTWSSEMEVDPNFDSRYSRTGIFDQIEMIKEYSLYQLAWTSYYLAYALPSENPEREKLLNDAIRGFQIFTVREDDFQAKWESFEGVGMCQRELAKTDEAVASLRKALQSESVAFNLTVYYELVQTYLKAKQFAQARSVLDELRGKNYPNIEETFIGGQLMPFLEAKIALAEGATSPEKKQQGLEMMRQLWNRGQFWHFLVAPEVAKYIDKSVAPDKLQPFELWIQADDVYSKGNFKDAVKYFDQYIKMTPGTDSNHAVAKFNLAACYYKLSGEEKGEERYKLLKMAAIGFRDLASNFPNFGFVDSAAEAYVTAAATLYDETRTEESLDFYAQSLLWSLTNRPKAAEAADMRWMYAGVLKAQKKYKEAAEQYAKVADNKNSLHYYEAQYQAPVCWRQDLLEKQVETASSEDFKRQANDVVTQMEKFVDQVLAMPLADASLEKTRRENAAQMLIMAGEILALDQIQEYQRGLRVIDRYEKEFPAQSQFMGEALTVKVYCLMGQNRLAEANRLLEELVKRNPSGLDNILQSMFMKITEEVTRLVEQRRMDEAKKKVAVADNIGKVFTDYLVKTPNQGEKIEIIRAQLAELHLKAREFEGATGAVERYKALIQFDPFEKPELMAKEGGRGVNLGYLTGLAESTMLLGQQYVTERNDQKAYDNLKRSAFYWETVSEGRAAEFDEESQRKLWEAELNRMTVYYDLQDQEQKLGKEGAKIDYHELIRKFFQFNMATNSTFGGPAMKLQFSRLALKVGISLK